MLDKSPTLVFGDWMMHKSL